MFDYHNPLVLLMSCCIFMGVYQLKGFAEQSRASGILRQASLLTFGVYLIHPLFIDALKEAPIGLLRSSSMLGIAIETFIVVLGSFGVCYILSRIVGLRKVI
jgi:surface polysaccharide O-acyltransferase-like enzyme